MASPKIRVLTFWYQALGSLKSLKRLELKSGMKETCKMEAGKNKVITHPHQSSLRACFETQIRLRSGY